jgi:two-component system chemotaxis response regulator CheB
VTAPAVPAKTTVIVVDDSPVQRRFVRAAVEADPDLTVIGEARNGKEAVALVARLRPAAVLMDLDLPVMSGIEAIEAIMAASPTPILVYSAHVGGADSTNALEALAAGAVDWLAKPGPEHIGTLDEYANQLRRRLKVAARVRVITHPRGKLRSQGIPVASRVGMSSLPVLVDQWQARQGVRLVAIGASTGGPQALHTVLKALPVDLDQAVLVVQHMAEGFIPGLVAWLDQLVPMPVVVGGSGKRLVPGTITIAPSGQNLLVTDDRLRVVTAPPDVGQFHVPGIDQCFASVAEALGPHAIGVLLTGMGRDGALGLKAMRDRGAFTLGQDEATSTVYGMPQVAFVSGAVETQLPVDAIAGAVLDLVGRS